MSYFDLPRIYFSGSFRASPSTVNNSPGNWAEPPQVDPLWNPKGAHDFQLLRGNEFTIPPGAQVDPCTVRAVATPGGAILTDPSTDPLIGQFVVSTNTPAVAKLVDLDPFQQQVSQIWGMQLAVGDLVGDYLATYFQQIFTQRAPGSFAHGFGAAYQTMLTNLRWPASPASPTLQRLKASSANRLSIRFTVDRLDARPFLDDDGNPTNDDTGNPNPQFTIGRIAGVIGPAADDEPSFITLGRMLRKGTLPGAVAANVAGMKELLEGAALQADPVVKNFNFAPAKVDATRNVVTIDLGNALPFKSDGDPANAGALQLAIQTSTGRILLGSIANTLANYRNQAFLFEFPLGGNAAAAASNPLVVLSDGNIVMTENPSGAWIDADNHVFRMDALADATVTLYATVFGAAAPNDTVTLTVQPLAPGTNVQPLTVQPASVTLSGGKATFTMFAGSPGNPRGPIDGQVYRVNFNWNKNTIPDPRAWVSAHVYDALPVPPAPDWTNDVLPIFQQMMVLYPFMQTILDLTDEPTVKANAKRIAGFMRFPMTHPHFMPVTRDLSGPKTEIVLKWLDAQ